MSKEGYSFDTLSGPVDSNDISRRPVDRYPIARYDKFLSTKTYNDVPPLPPQADLESRTVLKACIQARATVAELKQAGRLLPNQDVLINTIPLLEAPGTQCDARAMSRCLRLLPASGSGRRDPTPSPPAVRR